MTSNRARRWVVAVLGGVLVACTPSTPPREAVPAQPELVEIAAEEALPQAEPSPSPAPSPVPVEPQPEPQPQPQPPPAKTAPGRARSGFPDNVYAAYLNRETGWTVDIIDPWGRRTDRIWSALSLDELEIVENVELEPGGPGVPRGWKHGDRWTLVTRHGLMQRSAGRFVLEQGAGELHLEVELRRAKSPGRGTALAIRGTDVPSDLVLSPPRRVDDPRFDVETLRTTILARCKRADDRRLFRRARIAAKHVKVYQARLPPAFTDIVVVDAPLPGRDEDGRASALVLRNEGDDHVRIADNQGRIELLSILDINGDGTDEVVYEDSYYEGSYYRLLYFDEGEPKVRTLTGDGA